MVVESVPDAFAEFQVLPAFIEARPAAEVEHEVAADVRELVPHAANPAAKALAKPALKPGAKQVPKEHTSLFTLK